MSKNNKKTEQASSKPVSAKATKKRQPYFIQKIIAIFLIVCFAVGIGGGVLAYTYVKKVIDFANSLNISKIVTKASSTIYNIDGTQTISDLGIQTINNVTYDELPQVVVDALVSVEDSRFFTHNGFDIPRFTKAMVNNALCLCFDQGGSTLTMQVIKNSYFVDDETGLQATSGLNGIQRKISEIYLAPELERIMSKEEIIAVYLNSSNFGVSGSKGIYVAAETLFGKKVSELNLSEAAYLVGVVNSPAAYNPFFNYQGIVGYLDDASARRNTVLDLMEYHGYITAQERDLAKSVKLEDLFISQGSSNDILKTTYKYQAYIDAVVKEATEVTGKDPYETPMKIYTYIDTEVQELLEAIGNGDYTTDKMGISSSQEVSWANDEDLQAALTIINNSTGAVIGTLGGREYYGQKMFQRAFDSAVNPGSTAKPVIPYVLAFEYLGQSTGDSIMDIPYTYSGSTKEVYNYDKVFMGQIDLSYALGDSRNIPALETYDAVANKIGNTAIASYLKSMGISDAVADATNSQYAIGGQTMILSPTQLANMYQMLLNGGNYIKAHTIAEIQYTDGTAPYVADATPKKIVSSGAAYLMTDMLTKIVDSRLNTVQHILDRSYQVIGKTGTSTMEDGSTKNRWIVTGTSDFVWATWVGYDQEKSMAISQNLYNHNGRINSAILDLLQKKYGTPSNFSQPSDVTTITFIKGTTEVNAETGLINHSEVLPNMSSDMIRTGMIRTSFATLNSISETLKPSNLSDDINVAVVANGQSNTASITMPAYPDATMLTRSDGKLQMSNGKVGALQFHKTYIYGPIRYYAEVRDGTTVLATTKSESNSFTLNFSGGGNLQVCTYYAYDQNSSIKSNEVCRSVSIAQSGIKVPNFTDGTHTQSSFESFANTNGITNYSFTKVTTTDTSLNGKIATIKDVDISNQTLTADALKALKLTIGIYTTE